MSKKEFIMTLGIQIKCQYCSAVFQQFKELFEHYEAEHSDEVKEIKGVVHSMLGTNDTGCLAATEYLGYQSSCLGCPFPRCLEEMPGIGEGKLKKIKRDEEIVEKLREGASVEELALQYAVSQRTIFRIKERRE